MLNNFVPGNFFYRNTEVKKELEKRILNKDIVMDSRGGCDNDDCQGSHISFQYVLENGQHSEDGYCLNCHYKELYKELFPNQYKEDLKGFNKL